MTDAEIFHNETEQFGGRLNPDLFPERPGDVYTDIIEQGNDLIESVRHAIPELPPIHLDFVLNSAINAMAFKSHDRYFIGLHTGLAFMLRLVIGRMLSDRRLFLFVGNPDEEADELEPFVGYFPDAEEMVNKASVLTPNNSIRNSYRWFLMDQAIMFFVGHEIAHITRGHVDYLTEKRGAEFTTELQWFGTRSREEIIERQCLEQDADKRSIISRVDSIRKSIENPDFPTPPWDDEKGVPGFLLDWWISLNILFRLFGDVRFTHLDLNDSSYPPLPLRRAMCEMAAWGTAKNIWGDEFASIAHNVLQAGRNESELAFATMLDEEPSVEGLQQAFSQSGLRHAVALEDYWNAELEERLKPFSYEF